MLRDKPNQRYLIYIATVILLLLLAGKGLVDGSLIGVVLPLILAATPALAATNVPKP